MGQVTHKVELDSGQSIPFIPPTNTKAGCTPMYSLYKDDGTGTYVAYTDINPSYDIVDFNSALTEVQVTSSMANDGYIVLDTWKLRVSVASVPNISTADNPEHIYFTLTFDYPQ